MVFSVIGDSDSFVPRPWPTTLFQTALIEAAKSGGGTNLLIFIEYCNCIFDNASTSNNMMNAMKSKNKRKSVKNGIYKDKKYKIY